MNIYIVIIIQQLIASGTHLVSKSVTHNVDPVVLTFLRGIISIVAFSIIFFFRKENRINKADIPLLLWLSFIAVPINQFFYLYGMKYTLAANGALLYATTPAFVLVLSNFILREKMTIKKISGVIVAFIGVLVVVFEKGLDFSSDYFFGNVMVLIAVLAWALYAIQGKKLIIKYGAIRISSLTVLIGGILFIPLGIYNSLKFDFSIVVPSDWIGILYLSIFTSIISYIMWYYAIGKLDTTKVAVFTNAQPIFTTILAVLFLHQPVSTTFITGGIVTIAGVYLTQMK